jgi:hypothetical protein
MADESLIVKRRKNKKKPSQLDEIDLVEWFLAIDGCLSERIRADFIFLMLINSLQKENASQKSLKMHLNYRRVNMFTILNSDKRRGNPWRREAIIGLKNAGKQKV